MKNEINPEALYWALFNRFEIRIPGQAVMDCSHSGPCDDDVEHWAPKVMAQAQVDNFPNKPTAAKIRAELKEYGAWDADELEDDDANWRRLVWIAACNIADDDARDCSEPVNSSATKISPYTFEAPSYWASYLINGDYSGLEPSERAACDSFLRSEGLPAPVECSDESYIGRFNGLQTELLEYTSLIEKKGGAL